MVRANRTVSLHIDQMTVPVNANSTYLMLVDLKETDLEHD